VKKAVAIALLAGAGFLAYRWLGDRRAYAAYEGFADSWARENRTTAEKYGEAEAVRHAFEEKPLRSTEGGVAMEAFRGTLYAIESKTRRDGGFDLVVRQTILFDPPGVTTGIGGAMFARFRHAAKVRDTPDGWRVVAFEPTYLEMGPLRRR
jgi:hypothetical protein